MDTLPLTSDDVDLSLALRYINALPVHEIYAEEDDHGGNTQNATLTTAAGAATHRFKRLRVTVDPYLNQIVRVYDEIHERIPIELWSCLHPEFSVNVETKSENALVTSPTVNGEDHHNSNISNEGAAVKEINAFDLMKESKSRKRSYPSAGSTTQSEHTTGNAHEKSTPFPMFLVNKQPSSSHSLDPIKDVIPASSSSMHRLPLLLTPTIPYPNIFVMNEWPAHLKQLSYAYRVPQPSSQNTHVHVKHPLHVLYWMDSSFFVEGNAALTLSLWLSNRLKLPLVCILTVSMEFLNANPEYSVFLSDLEVSLAHYAIPLLIFRYGTIESFVEMITKWTLVCHTHIMITDDNYHSVFWSAKQILSTKLRCAIYSVTSDSLIQFRYAPNDLQSADQYREHLLNIVNQKDLINPITYMSFIRNISPSSLHDSLESQVLLQWPLFVRNESESESADVVDVNMPSIHPNCSVEELVYLRNTYVPLFMQKSGLCSAAVFRQSSNHSDTSSEEKKMDRTVPITEVTRTFHDSINAQIKNICLESTDSTEISDKFAGVFRSIVAPELESASSPPPRRQFSLLTVIQHILFGMQSLHIPNLTISRFLSHCFAMLATIDFRAIAQYKLQK